MKSVISLLLVAALAATNSSCKKEVDPHAHHKMEAGKISGASLYQFHDMFTDQNGKQLMLHQLQGEIRRCSDVLCDLHGDLPAYRC
jgi:hypothetical protein